MKIKVLAGICLAIIVIGGIAGGLYYINNYEAVYYSQVDNTQVSQLSSSDRAEVQFDELPKKIQEKLKN